MRRREQREHIFKLLFMTEFNSEEEAEEAGHFKVIEIDDKYYTLD